MDGDRKYSQGGYMDSNRPNRSNGSNGNGEKFRPQGPKPSLDITGPRLPRLVQSVTAARCYNCSTAFPAATDFMGTCQKCGAELHCCKQCSHFEPSTRFQCDKPIQVRIALKDQKNECPLFAPRVTVARDGSGQPPQRSASADILAAPPRNASDARSAFDRLFKK